MIPISSNQKMNDAKIEKKPRILIVEDELESQKYLELILKKKFQVDF
jgi:PleD family two-component response regulator